MGSKDAALSAFFSTLLEIDAVGRETQPFKTGVRKLKALGLTISLETGYRLSPRGEAFLRRGAQE